MKLKMQFYLTSIIIPSLLFFLIFFIPYPIVIILLLLVNYFFGASIKCPQCHIKINEFYRPFSKHFQGFKCRLPDKCPECGCEWK